MPPVREASTKPSAATVLPAPVACSNQKRRAAPGSSSDGVGGSLLLGLLGRIPVERLLVGQLVALDLDLAGVAAPPSRRFPLPLRADLELGARARSACRTARPPGGPTASCRRPGAAPPRRAAARARASASNSRRHSTDGSSRPASISASAASSAARRARALARARARRPRPRARRSRARIPRRASGHRRKPARHRPRSFSQPRFRRSSVWEGAYRVGSSGDSGVTPVVRRRSLESREQRRGQVL